MNTRQRWGKTNIWGWRLFDWTCL